jgi:hypothetical protein
MDDKLGLIKALADIDLPIIAIAWRQYFIILYYIERF